MSRVVIRSGRIAEIPFLKHDTSSTHRHRNAAMASSSSRKKKSPKEEEGPGTSRWSQWEWNYTHDCYSRYRLNREGAYEFDYKAQESGESNTSREIPRYAPSVGDTSASQADAGSTYGTSPGYELSTGSALGALDLNKGKERETTYGSQAQDNYAQNYVKSSSDWQSTSTTSYYPSLTQTASNEFYPAASQESAYQDSYTGRPTSASASTIKGDYQTTQQQENLFIGPTTGDENELNPEFKVHHASFFKFGKVFKILWAEPTGVNGTQITENAVSYSTKLGQEFTHKIRRFVVVKRFDGHCLALPILTYNKRATTKSGSHGADHAIIYTKEAVTYEGEKIGKKSIRVNPKTPRDKLLPQSRLNYAKVYTIEYNVKVLFVGEVHKDYLHQLKADYHNTQGYYEKESGPSQ